MLQSAEFMWILLSLFLSLTLINNLVKLSLQVQWTFHPPPQIKNHDFLSSQSALHYQFRFLAGSPEVESLAVWPDFQSLNPRVEVATGWVLEV